MANQTFINRLTSGMHSDFDPAAQPPDTYRYGQNARVIFNNNGTLTWTSVKGNEQLFTLNALYNDPIVKYDPIGWCEIGDQLVIMSTDNTNSEIGIYPSINGALQYETMFNDFFDPNAELLNFSTAFDIQAAIPVVENEKVQRIYFTDNNNEDWVFNIRLGLQSVSPEFVNGDYQPVSGTYPSFYSTHSIIATADLSPGIIKYVQGMSGNLLSGVYQYIYRLATRDGYKTPWSVPTTPIFLTTDAIDSGNSQNYAMEASQQATSKGIQIQVKGVDTRFDTLEVGYIYTITESQSLSAAIFATIMINSTANITVNHLDTRGTPIALDAINIEMPAVKTVKTINTKEKRLFKGGITTYPTVFFDTSAVTVAPYVKSMIGDQNTLSEEDNPFVNTTTYGTTTSICKYIDNTSAQQKETHQIIGDYINYKGTQIAHLYQGYFRGEWYRFGIAFQDKKGNLMFVNYLCDIQFPAQWDNHYTVKSLDANGNPVENTFTLGSVGDYTTTDNGANANDRVDNNNASSTIRTRIMGMLVNNIDLTDIINNDEIGGFYIVRVERDPTILAQGMLLNTVSEDPGGANPDPLVTRPMGYPSDRFYGFDSSNIWVNEIGNNVLGRESQPQRIRPYTFTYECPDYLFDTKSIPTLQTNHKLQNVVGCWMTTPVGNVGYGYQDFGADSTSANGRAGLINKTYNTSPTGFWDAFNHTVQYGFSKGISFYRNFGYGNAIAGYDPANPTWEFDATVEINNNGTASPPFTNNRRYQGGYHNDGLIIKTTDLFENSIFRTDLTSYVSYSIANYCIPDKVPYGGINADSLANAIYISTGHFQPINDTVKAQVISGGRYIFNNVEVWGGDCFVNLFGLARVYATGDHTSSLHNVAIGNVFPCEMKYNAALRKGNTWMKNGFFAIAPFYPNGVDNPNFEDELINDVLAYSETNVLFNGKPVNFANITQFWQRWLYSNQKTYGELTDSYRQFPVNQFDDMDGRYGKIQGSTYIFDNIYSFQEHAYGYLRVAQRALNLDPSTGFTRIGIGGILDNIAYINTKYGTQHGLSIVNTGHALYWVDAYERSICRHGNNGFEQLDNVHGLHNYIKGLFTNGSYDFSADNPSLRGGIHSTVDFENKEILFTFVNAQGMAQTALTLSFSEENNAFNGFYSFIPRKYFNLGAKLMSYNPVQTDKIVYLHNSGFTAQFYGTDFDTILTVVANPASDDTKVFATQQLNSNNVMGNGNGLFSALTLTSDQNSDSATPQTDNRYRYREGTVWYPLRGLTAPSPVRGQWVEAQLTFHNTGTNDTVSIKSIQTLWRFSHKH